ncbi:MAG TPA: hypothetical protein VFI11_03840 [Anaerolineales bacterium]|nr:hypothetical protein [Anaerolineales bacterium]
MRGCLFWITRILSVALALAFVLTLPLTIVAFDLGRVVFSPDRMAAVLNASFEESGGFRRVAMDAIASGGEGGATEDGGLDLTTALSYLSPLERDYLADRLLPGAWVADQVRASVDSVFAWIDNDQARPNIRLDLRPVKDAIRSGGADELVEMVVDSWPPCSLEQLTEMAGTALGLTEGFPFCEPPEPLRTGVVAMAGETLILSVYALPDTMQISGQGAAPANAEVMRFKDNVRLVRALSRWGWLLTPVLLGGIMLLAIRTWRGLALWWGLPIILGGLLTLVVSVGARAIVAAFAAGIAASPGMPMIVADMVTSAGQAWVGIAMRVILVHAGLAVLIGAAVFALGMLLGRRSRSTRAEPRPAAPPPPRTPGPVEPDEDDESGRRPGMYG